MMIAARLAGGNLFFCLFWVEGLLGVLGAARSTRIFFEGICGGGGFLGALGAARSSSEHSFFFEGICGGGILFFGWWGVFWIVSVGKN